MRIPRITIPLLVMASLLGGYTLRAAFTQPTTAIGTGAGEGARLECTVAGVKCKGTARFFTTLYEGVPGIHGIVTYASEHQVLFTYDPDVITPDQIQRIMEQPVPLNDGRSLQLFQCLSREEL
jgi:hypothetical protein